MDISTQEIQASVAVVPDAIVKRLNKLEKILSTPIVFF